MAAREIFPIIPITGTEANPMVSQPYPWPANAGTSVKFWLIDDEFTDPADSFTLIIELSWATTGGQNWSYSQRSTIVGGAKSKDGSPWATNLNVGSQGVPKHIRFKAFRVSGAPRCGLMAEGG